MTITSNTIYKWEGGGQTQSIDFMTENGTRVLLSISSNGSYTVVYKYNQIGRRNRRIGKTFWSLDEMMAHYKTIRSELLAALQEPKENAFIETV